MQACLQTLLFSFFLIGREPAMSMELKRNANPRTARVLKGKPDFPKGKERFLKNNSKDILNNMTEIKNAIDGISRAVEESATGVTDAAMNVDSLVQSITTVSSQMEENSEVAKALKEESENFVNV